jgi:WD40 repeat protein
VTGLIHSETHGGFVTFHGYSMNNLVVWNSETLKPIRTYNGHEGRVIYYAVSPCGTMGVTGGDDSTIRFWKLFPDLNGRDPVGSGSAGAVNNNENFRVGKGASVLSRNKLEKFGAKRGNFGIPTIR